MSKKGRNPENEDLYPETESFTALVSPNIFVVVSNSLATPNPVLLVKRLAQQAVWTSATTSALLTSIEIDVGSKPKPFPGTVVNGILSLPASTSGVCASGPIEAAVQPPVTYTSRTKIGGAPGPRAGIRIDP